MSKPLMTIGGTGISIKVGSRIVEPVTVITHAQSAASAPVNVREMRAKKRDRKIRSTSFNVTDPLERQLNAHADRFSCFSTYVKRLIHEDILRGNTTASSASTETRYYDAMTPNVAAEIGGAR